MNINQEILLSLVRGSLFKKTPLITETADWPAIFQESLDQTVVGLVVPEVNQLAKKNNIPNLDQWNGIGNQLHSYFIRCFFAQRELVKSLEENGIPIVIVKGYAAAVYYPNPKLRTMGDIDFLVPKDRYEEAQILMERLGFQLRVEPDEDTSRHIGYIKHNILYELHRSIGSFGVDIDSVIERVIDKPDTGIIAGLSFPMLPPFENGLVLISHIRQHLLEESYSLGLRQILDWMMYVNFYNGTEIEGVEWDKGIMSSTKMFGLDTLAITVTYICKEWLGLMNVPEWSEKADRTTAEELLEMIMASGNFGSKIDKNRDSIIIKQSIVLNRKMRLFNWLQNRGVENWKLAQNHHWLRPFAWIYQGFRVIGLGFKSLLLSKKGVKQISEGNKKNALLKKLGI